MTLVHPSPISKQPAANVMSRFRSALRNAGPIVPHLIGFATLFLAWHIASTYIVRSVLFPAPLTVLSKAVKLAADGSLFENIAVSLGALSSDLFQGLRSGFQSGCPSAASRSCASFSSRGPNSCGSSRQSR